MFDQASVLIKKNLTLHTRSRQFMTNLYIPVLCSLFTIISKYHDNKSIDSFSSILLYMYQLWPLYLVMPTNGIIRQTVAIIVEERSGRFKEIQRTMGMQLNAYYLSWVLSTVALCLMTSAIYIIPQMIFQTYSFPEGDMNFALAFLTYLLYALGSACFNLFLSSFFDEASVASEVLGLGNLFLSLYGIGAAMPGNNSISWLYYIFPQTILQAEWFSQRWWYNLTYSYNERLPIGVMIFFQILQIVVYLLGYLYFDQVLPRDSGPSKKPLFFLQGNNEQVYMDLEEDLLPQRQEQINISLQIQHNEPFNIQQNQVNLEPLVYLNDVSKRLGGQTILQSVSLEIYPGEIFFLLGPNGSGKTTLSNIIAGFSKPSGGVVKVCNQDQASQGQISICMQKDILYADLTVWDHLYFYAHLKNVYRENFLQQGAQLLETCLLSLYRDVPASKLSGGNKRKLCLAIALLGDPKVIILDEPSSGVDPVTREELWRVIRSVKQGRAIFMTTHHLEEAEELASRVGILFGGQIVTMGTVDYIKSNFGLGYNLTLEFADQMTLKANKDRVQKEIGLETREVNQHTLIVNLPPSIMGQYYQILGFLETQIPCQISLFQNSLEDAYLAVEKRNSHELIDQDCQQVFRAQPEITFMKQVQAMAWRKYLFLTASKGKLFRQFYTWPIILLGIRFGLVNPLFFVVLYILAKSLSISSILSIPVEENEKRIKDYLISSGLDMTAYWTGTFLADLVPITIESLFIAICLTVFDVGFWAQNFGLVFIVLVFFGMNFNAFCYFVSLYIKKSITAYVTLPVLTFFVMFWVLFIPFAQYVGNNNFVTVLTMIVSPLLSLYMGLALTPNMYSEALFSVGACIGWMVLSSAIYFSFIVLVEKKRQMKTSQENSIDAIKCTQISKGHILENLDFSVREGEIFGLLGPNGAGKTTAFNILTKFDQQTSGEVTIQGNKIGAVPQFSPFYSHLNIYQHMKIYGLIKGQVEIEDCIQRYLRAVGLDGMQKRQVRFLSGGERRKLQIGLALIGGSNRLFMDEPTSGLDPKARKVVQSILTQSARNSNASVIITTHSLLEAQTICDRVGILVNGRIVALGTMEQLRTALGGYMRISMCCNAGRQAQVNATTQQYLTQYFPIQQVPDNRDMYLSYQFTPQKLSLLYFFLQKELKERLQLITNYNIFQTQLDQIFKFYTLLQHPGAQIPEEQNQFMPGDALRILTGACCCTFW